MMQSRRDFLKSAGHGICSAENDRLFWRRRSNSFSKQMRDVPAGVGCESRQEHDPPQH